MKHMIKKTMLTGALSCFLLGLHWLTMRRTSLRSLTGRTSKSLPFLHKLWLLFMSYEDRATALSSRYEKSPLTHC